MSKSLHEIGKEVYLKFKPHLLEIKTFVKGKVVLTKSELDIVQVRDEYVWRFVLFYTTVIGFETEFDTHKFEEIKTFTKRDAIKMHSKKIKMLKIKKNWRM
jgi:hypothetical protein